MFGIYCSLPSNWGNINAIKSVDATGFTEGTPIKGLCPINDQPKAFKVIYDPGSIKGRNYDVITEHKYRAGMMNPLTLQ
jgi:hypothetical protein